MRDLLVRFYHLGRHAAQLAQHVASAPFVQAAVASALIAVVVLLLAPRNTRDRTSLGAGLAVLCGWCVLTWPLLAAWPLAPVARLPGAAILVILMTLLEGRAASPAPGISRKVSTRAGLVRKAPARGVGRRATKSTVLPHHQPAASWWMRPLICVIIAWWLRGAPTGANTILNGMPLFLGLLAGWSIAARLARQRSSVAGAQGWAVIAAFLTLAGSMQVVGVSPHWVRLAALPAIPALVLLANTGAMSALIGMLVAVSGATIVASDRGRFVPADTACLMPLVALYLAPRLTLAKRSGWQPPLGAALATGLCVTMAWVIRSGMFRWG